jgi:hypothetical protein
VDDDGTYEIQRRVALSDVRVPDRWAHLASAVTLNHCPASNEAENVQELVRRLDSSMTGDERRLID